MEQSSSFPQGFPSGNPLVDFLGARVRVVDLTHSINDHSPMWPGDTKSFEARPNANIERDGYFTRSFWMLEHYGTHLDAPAHFAAGKMTVDEIPAERLMGPAVVLDVRSEFKSHAEGVPDYRVPVEAIRKWEGAHGPIPAGAIVLLRTGCASHWLDADRYRNIGSDGSMHFPGFSVEAVRYLVSKGISGIGADSMSVDPGDSKDYTVHHLALGSDLFHVENLADLSAVPEAGAWLIVAPIKLEGGSGGPCRVYAIVSK